MCNVEGGVGAPVEAVLLDVLRGDEAGEGVKTVLDDVGGVVGGDGDALIERTLAVMRVVELAGEGEGIAEEEHLLGVESLQRLEVGLLDALGFRDDDHELGEVEALEVVLAVGGDAEADAVGAGVVLADADFAGEAVFGGGVGGAQLLPADLLDLPKGWPGDDDLGLGSGLDPPKDGASGGPVLAGGVAPDDGDAAFVGDEGIEELFLLGVGRAGAGEDVFDEPEGVVSVGREVDGGILGARELDGVLLSWRPVERKRAAGPCCGAAGSSARGWVGCRVYVGSMTE